MVHTANGQRRINFGPIGVMYRGLYGLNDLLSKNCVVLDFYELGFVDMGRMETRVTYVRHILGLFRRELVDRLNKQIA